MITNIKPKEKLVQSAQTYVQKGQIKKAIGEFEKVIKEDPENPEIRMRSLTVSREEIFPRDLGIVTFGD